MSMHGSGEDAYKRINQSVNSSMAEELSEEEKKSTKKRCITIVVLVSILIAALLVLILVLVIKGSSSDVPNGTNPYTIEEETDGLWYWQARLKRTNNITYPVPVDDKNPAFEDLKMRVSMLNDGTFRLRINPIKSNSDTIEEYEDIKRWEVPDYLLGNMEDNYGMRLAWSDFKSSKSPGGIEIMDPRDKKSSFFTTINRNLLFTEKYLELGFLIDSQEIFGFGERVRSFELHTGNYSSWADGRKNLHDPGELGNNLNGDHPFVLARLKNGNFMGIFFLNSNAKTLEYTHVGKDKSILNFRSTGGILDFFTFAGETPEEVIKLYHNVIGKPAFPPFWALGYHQGSMQYDTTQIVGDVLIEYDTNNIPLESIWFDIDYMDHYHNFEVDKNTFATFGILAESMHKKDQRVVCLIDSGFHADEDYSYYKQANEQGLLIKSNNNPSQFNGNIIGKSWPGSTAYVDFTNPKTTDWWVNAMVGLHSQTSMDGVYLDMNEIESGCDGECPGQSIQLISDANSTLPFNPLGEERNIESNTLSMNAQYYSEKNEDRALNQEFNWHSLYGTMQARTTMNYWLYETGIEPNIPFVMSRSTFAGAGKYAGQWLGNNLSTWNSMQMSISGIMNSNMFGIPLVGADICGFYGKFDEEMCGRWYQLSTFYPFARNHYNYTDGTGEALPPQEAYNLAFPYNETAKAAIIQRYSFLRYFYTNFFEMHKNGGTMFKPLFFEFPDDVDAYKGTEHSFMVGKALKVTPVVVPESEHKGEVKSYFPEDSRFISLNDFSTIIEGGGGKNVTLKTSLDHTIVHMREGTIIPWQNQTEHFFDRTTDLINERGLDILIFPDKNGYAEGSLYIDENGNDLNQFETEHYEYYTFRFSNNNFKIMHADGRGSKGDLEAGNHIIKDIYVLGTPVEDETNLNACAFSNDMVPEDVHIVYDKDKKYLKISEVNSGTITFHEFSSVHFSTSASDMSFCHPKYTVSSISTESNEYGNIPVKKVMVKSETNLPDLTFNFILIKNNMVRVFVEDASSPNPFKVTDDVFDPEMLPLDGHLALEDIEDVLTVPAEGEEFFFEIHQFQDPQKVLYSTKGQSMIHTKNFMKIVAEIDSNGRIFGLGERVGNFLLSEGVYTIWTRDEPSPIDEGKRPGGNIYGAHPVYFTQMKNKQFFAVFDNNAGAQDYIIKKSKNGMLMTHIKTSGMTDMIFLLNDNIASVSSEFINLVGHPSIVPDWSLGWHQCRWGYNSSKEVESVVNGYIQNNFPLDAIWTDIDYMDMYRDFTISERNFSDLPGMISNWRINHAIHYVPIMDAGIAYEPDNKKSAYSRGKSKKVFIMDGNDDSKPFVGKVWPGPAVFIDWLKKEAQEYWMNEMEQFYDMIQFDGMWIDMNEAANFCNGPCSRKDEVKNSVQDNLFYLPGARDLNTKSISIDAKHVNGTLEFEAHSLYGFYMGKATSSYFTEKLNQRQFIISRSTYTGFGKYASHWLGDNFSHFDWLKYSIGGIYNFNLFGIPVTGADICGFLDNTYPDLCARWYAVGAFYPFARNHNDQKAIPQEPFVDMFNEKMPNTGITYTDFMRKMAFKRYALHRYQYTWMHKASYEGEIYFKPTFFNYPEDDLAFENPESNIMLGDSIKVSPILEDSKTEGKFYFPDKNALWCPVWPGRSTDCLKGGSYKEFKEYYLDEIQVHIKSGSIVPLQLGDLSHVPNEINIEKLKNVGIDLAILTDKSHSALGIVRYDDGKTQDLTRFTEFQFRAQGVIPSIVGTEYLDIYVQNDSDLSDDKTSNNQNIESIVIYNPLQYNFKSNAIGSVTFKDGTQVNLAPEYDEKTKICRLFREDAAVIPIREIEKIHIRSKPK